MSATTRSFTVSARRRSTDSILPLYRWVGAVLFVIAAPLAKADNVWCVNNTASFEQALNSARDDDTLIKVVRGDYLTFGIEGGTFADDIDHDLTIVGGYADGTCSEAGRSLDPASTVFHPVTIGGAYAFDVWIDGDVLMKSITLRGYGYGAYIESTGDAFSGDSLWTFDRVRIEQSGGLTRPGWAGPSEPLALLSFFDADVTLRQVVVVDNATTQCAVALYAADQAVAVVQSTFARNGGTGLCIDGDGAQNAPVDIDNNIFWGGGCGLEVRDTPAAALHVRHNTLDCTAYDALPSIDIGNDALDPQFVDAANGDYRLLLTSPAVDSGANPPTGGLPGTDIVGNPRVIGAGVDRGPWETDQSNATILIVSNTAPAGAGSLAAAIEQSNTLPDVQIIRFAIPGNCPQVIFQFQGQGLPDITDSVRIEGYSQSGSVRGAPQARTICVGIWGNQEILTLLRVPLGADVSLDVSGVGFGGTTFNTGAAAITLLAGSGHQITGNQFGGAIGPNSNPVQLNVLQNGIIIGFSTHESYIGGWDPEQGNVFNSASASAIDIGAMTTQPAHIYLINNFIGLKPSGISADGNGTGVSLGVATGNFVLNNWISGNAGDGVVLKSGADDNILVGNQIGRCSSCLTPPLGSEILVGNGVHGVLMQAGADGNVLNGNRIAGNGFGYAEENGANGNALVQNAIYRNGGLGIDIGRDGVTPNDSGGINTDGVPNFPLIGSAGGGFYNGTVRGVLTSLPERTYAIEIYASDSCDGSGYGEGQKLIGQSTVTTPVSPLPGLYSSANFEVAVASGGLADKAITTIARGPSGDTSEFSPCVNYVYSDVIFQDDFEGP